jgi:CrcB protein
VVPRHPLRPAVIGVVAVGGAAGALLRWGLEEGFPVESGAFPLTTLGINVVGSLLLALLPASAYVRRHALLPPLLGSGVLGGFTTLSTMSEESRALLDGGHAGLAATYLLVTLGACMLAVALADRFSSRRDRQEFEDEEGDL